MKIAIFKDVNHGYETYCDERFETIEGYVRSTEYVDVEFVKLENTEVTAKEVALLRDVKKKIQAETEVKLEQIDQKIGELLALPSPP